MVVAVEVGEEEEDPRNFSRLPEKLMSLLVDGEAGATSLRKAKERPRTSFNLIVRINPSFVTAECNITLHYCPKLSAEETILRQVTDLRPGRVDLDAMRP